MGSIKKIGVVLALLFLTIILFVITDSNDTCDTCSKTVEDKPSTENTLVIETPNKKMEVTSKSPPKAVQASEVKFNRHKKSKGKKGYQGDWCIANIELNEGDYRYAQDEIRDWDKAQGKAAVKDPYSSYSDERFEPNNSLVESYEALPLEQLKALANTSDKWAMITFVQNQFAGQSNKNDIARKLLVRGAPYFALEQLVIDHLVTAQTVYRQTGDLEKSRKHVIDALVYAYWGLDNYSVGGLNPYLSITSQEPFVTKLPLNILVANSDSDIKARYDKLTNWMQQERDKIGVQVPEVPRAAKNRFAEYIAINQLLARKQMDFLANLHITESNPITNTPCVKEYSLELK